MFEFAIYLAVTLLGCMTATHWYFSDKVKTYRNQAKERFCSSLAEFNIERLREFLQLYGSQSIPPYEKLKEMYQKIYKNELEAIDMLVNAEKPSRWLNNALLSFVIAIILFFICGVLSYTPFFTFSFPTLLVGIIMVIVGAVEIYRIMRVI
jgi:hypothetical protein